MRALFVIPLLLCGGCVSFVKELKRPPFPYAITHHTRVVGIETSVPNQAGDAIFKLRLGFFSDSISLLPCATNEIHIVNVSDTFRLGQSISDTTITEDLVTGWNDQPPPSRHNSLFAPKQKMK